MSFCPGSTGGFATIVADYGALVKGGGSYFNPVKTQNGGKFQAGNSPGVATSIGPNWNFAAGTR